MFKKLLGVVILATLIITPSLAQPSDTPLTMEYGQDAKVVFPANAPDLELTFDATAGDIVVVEVFADPDELFTFFIGEVVIANDRGTTLADSGDLENAMSDLQSGNFLKASVAAEILSDGTHSIIVEPSEYAPITEDTNIVVRVINVPIIEPGASVTGTVTATEDGFHAVISGDPFEIAFVRKGGDVKADLYINRLDSGVLEPLAELSGTGILSGTVVIEPSRVRLHLIRVAKSALEFSYGAVSADYELTLSSAE